MEDYNTLAHEEQVQTVYSLTQQLPVEQQQRIKDAIEKNKMEARA